MKKVYFEEGIKSVKCLPVSLSSNSQYLCVRIIGSSEIGVHAFMNENISIITLH